MDSRLVKRAGHRLHRLVTGAVFADGGEVAPAIHEHFMPVEKQVVGEGSFELAIHFHHHLGNALLGGGDLAVVGGEAEISANG